MLVVMGERFISFDALAALPIDCSDGEMMGQVAFIKRWGLPKWPYQGGSLVRPPVVCPSPQ